MAYTTIHPIKSTLNLAINYITDPKKTNDESLVSTYKCQADNAHIQMLETRNSFNKKNTKEAVLARHLIQSFLPGEVTPEKAHEIGKAFAEKILNNKYEYVIATHTDKDHIHNHIIFNNVNLESGLCYRSNKRTYRRNRQISDDICKEYGLSIIDKYYNKYKEEFSIKGKSWYEYQQHKKGSSWKSKLQFDIDRLCKKSKSWEEFLDLMKKAGYEIKYGKHIAFKYKDKKRFTRAKTIGEDYTEEKLKERISKDSKEHNKFKENDYIININTDKMKKAKGLEMWAKRKNISLASRAIVDMQKEGIGNIEDLDIFIKDNFEKADNVKEKIKDIDQKINEKIEIMELVNTIKKQKPYYDYYKTNKKDHYFKNEYRQELEEFSAAVKQLKLKYPKRIPDTKDIYLELKKLKSERDKLKINYNEYKEKAIRMAKDRSLISEYKAKGREL